MLRKGIADIRAKVPCQEEIQPRFDAAMQSLPCVLRLGGAVWVRKVQDVVLDRHPVCGQGVPDPTCQLPAKSQFIAVCVDGLQIEGVLRAALSKQLTFRRSPEAAVEVSIK